MRHPPSRAGKTQADFATSKVMEAAPLTAAARIDAGEVELLFLCHARAALVGAVNREHLQRGAEVEFGVFAIGV